MKKLKKKEITILTENMYTKAQVLVLLREARGLKETSPIINEPVYNETFIRNLFVKYKKAFPLHRNIQVLDVEFNEFLNKNLKNK